MFGRVGWGQWQEEWLVLRPVVPAFPHVTPPPPPVLFELRTVSSLQTALGPASPRTPRGLVILFLPDSLAPATKPSPATSVKAVGPWVSEPWFPFLPQATQAETITQE